MTKHSFFDDYNNLGFKEFYFRLTSLPEPYENVLRYRAMLIGEVKGSKEDMKQAKKFSTEEIDIYNNKRTKDKLKNNFSNYLNNIPNLLMRQREKNLKERGFKK